MCVEDPFSQIRSHIYIAFSIHIIIPDFSISAGKKQNGSLLYQTQYLHQCQQIPGQYEHNILHKDQLGHPSYQFPKYATVVYTMSI